MEQLSTVDRVIAGAALVAFVSLFLPWYGVTVGAVDVTGSGGVTGSLGALLLTAAGVLVVYRKAGGALRSGRHAAPSGIVVLLAALGLLLVIVRWATLPRVHASAVNFSYSVGPRYGLYVALLAGIAETVAAVMALRSASEQAPWDRPAEADPPSAPDE
jgi:hypothetical protein